MQNMIINIKSFFHFIFFKKKENELPVQFFRYLVSSAFALVLDYTTYLLLTRLFHVNDIISNIIGNTVGMLVNYFLNISWVFEKRKIKNKIFEFILFIITFFLGTGLHTIIFWFLKEIFLIYDIISRIIATGISYIFRFVLRRTILFK